MTFLVFVTVTAVISRIIYNYYINYLYLYQANLGTNYGVDKCFMSYQHSQIKLT